MTALAWLCLLVTAGAALLGTAIVLAAPGGVALPFCSVCHVG